MNRNHKSEYTDSSFISIVTPFYNTGAYLAECIESVLKQTYPRFEYILANNCSTDRSLSIAEKYAALDQRIRIVNNDRFLSQVENYNHALRRICEKSNYVKIVQADDWLYPQCIEEMVNLAEKSPRIGIISSYQLWGNEIRADGLEYGRTIFPGREICRRQLLNGEFYFGTPTSLLFQADLVRQRQFFYAESVLHEDTEVCYEILQDHDFGFVHQVLTFSRTDNESITRFIRDYNPNSLDKLIIIQKYGQVFLDRHEHAQLMARKSKSYFRFLAKNLFCKNDKAFWDYHRNGLKTIGVILSWIKLFPYILWAISDFLLNPKDSAWRIMNNLKKKAG